MARGCCPFSAACRGYRTFSAPFTFQTLLADPENIVDNFRAYLNGFSDNVQDILARMEFDAQIKHMDEAGLLYQLISDFCDARGDFSPEKVSAVDMAATSEDSSPFQKACDCFNTVSFMLAFSSFDWSYGRCRINPPCSRTSTVR